MNGDSQSVGLGKAGTGGTRESGEGSFCGCVPSARGSPTGPFCIHNLWMVQELVPERMLTGSDLHCYI